MQHDDQHNMLTVMDQLIVRLMTRVGSADCLVKLECEATCLFGPYAKLLKLDFVKRSKEGDGIYQIPGPCAQPGLYLVRALLEVILDSLPKFLSFTPEQQFSAFEKVRYWPSSSFVKFAKYCLVWPFARCRRQVLPKVPVGFIGSPLLFSGKPLQMLRSRLVSQNKSSWRLWVGYLQGVKRGCEQVSDQMVYETYLNHRTVLSTPPPSSDAGDHNLDDFRRFVDRFLAFGWNRNHEPKLYTPSKSASFEFGVAAGGAYRTVIEKVTGKAVVNPFLDAITNTKVSVERLEYLHDLKIALRDRTVASLDPLCDLSRPTVAGPRFDADCDILGYAYTHDNGWVPKFGTRTPSWNEALELAKASEDCEVSIMAVLEPLKVRVISKGNALRYWVSKSFQKQMWGFLQGLPQCVLTGHPLDETHLEGILTRERKIGLEFSQPMWASGDYAAATDSLDINFTKLCFEGFLSRSKGYTDDAKDVLRSVLYEQGLNYPDVKGYPEIPRVMQATGQLMGSPLSFPILNMVNLICYWQSLETYLGRRLALRDLPVLVNGDDILFRADARLYAIWTEKITNVGFKFSLGKNYLDAELLTANSQFFHFRDGKFTKLTYLNTGLLTGQAKVTGREKAKAAPIWDHYNEVVPNAVNIERAHLRFVHYHKAEIVKYTMNGLLNLFIPIELGGLGFKQVVPFYLTKFQRQLARSLKEQYESDILEGHPPQRPHGVFVEKMKPLVDEPIHYYWPVQYKLDEGVPAGMVSEIPSMNLSVFTDTGSPRDQVLKFKPLRPVEIKLARGLAPLGRKRCLKWDYGVAYEVRDPPVVMPGENKHIASIPALPSLPFFGKFESPAKTQDRHVEYWREPGRFKLLHGWSKKELLEVAKYRLEILMGLEFSKQDLQLEFDLLAALNPRER